MNDIYLVTRNGKTDYEEYHSIVVICDSDVKAKNICIDLFDTEPVNMTAKLLGTSSLDEQIVVCAVRPS